MKNREAISFLKEGHNTMPQGAVERCIAALPEIKKRNRLLPLLKLQFRTLPIWAYVLSLLGIVFQGTVFALFKEPDAMRTAAISDTLLVLLLGYPYVFSGAGSMDEMERSCKYSFGQILLAKTICICLLAGISQSIALLLETLVAHTDAVYLLGSCLPTLLGSLAALCWANYISKNDGALISVYLVAALISSLILDWIVEIGIVVICLVAFAGLAAIFFQTKILLNRMIPYEAYNY
jgi:hypothetical protein